MIQKFIILQIFILILAFNSLGKDLPDQLPDPLSPISSNKNTKKPSTEEHKENIKFNNNKSKNLSKEAQKTEKNDIFKKKIIGKVGKWTAIHATPKSRNVCYAILYSDERKSNEGKKKQEKPYIMVHYFSENKIRFSAYFGYQLLPNYNVSLSIDSVHYKLQSLGEYAIAESFQEDYDIINAMQDSTKLIMHSRGYNYSYAIDIYDLSNFSEIFQILQSNCDSTTNNSSFKGIVPTKEDIKKLH
jgi:hypothetical protein